MELSEKSLNLKDFKTIYVLSLPICHPYKNQYEVSLDYLKVFMDVHVVLNNGKITYMKTHFQIELFSSFS